MCPPSSNFSMIAQILSMISPTLSDGKICPLSMSVKPWAVLVANAPHALGTTMSFFSAIGQDAENVEPWADLRTNLSHNSYRDSTAVPKPTWPQDTTHLCPSPCTLATHPYIQHFKTKYALCVKLKWLGEATISGEEL